MPQSSPPCSVQEVLPVLADIASSLESEILFEVAVGAHGDVLDIECFGSSSPPILLPEAGGLPLRPREVAATSVIYISRAGLLPAT